MMRSNSISCIVPVLFLDFCLEARFLCDRAQENTYRDLQKPGVLVSQHELSDLGTPMSENGSP